MRLIIRIFMLKITITENDLKRALRSMAAAKGIIIDEGSLDRCLEPLRELYYAISGEERL